MSESEKFRKEIMPRINSFMEDAYDHSDIMFVLCGHHCNDGSITYVMSTSEPDFKYTAEGICGNMDLMQAINNILSDALESMQEDEKAVDNLINEVFKKNKNNEK